MNPITIALIALRSSALALTVAGDTKTSGALYGVADAIEAGRATDAHMALVAEKLKERDLVMADWTDVLQRIDADHSRLHTPG